jgi:hypothetical protein
MHRDQRSQVGIKAVVVRRWQTLLSNLAIVCCILGTTGTVSKLQLDGTASIVYSATQMQPSKPELFRSNNTTLSWSVPIP